MSIDLMDHLPQDGPLVRQHHLVRGVKGKYAQQFVFLNPAFVLLGTHYLADEQRTVPHRNDDGCIYCNAGLGKRPKGYMAALSLNSNETLVLEVSEGALRDLFQAQKGNQGMRGLNVVLKRKHDHRNAKLCAEIVGGSKRPTLPDGFDVVPYLERYFGVCFSTGEDLPKRHSYR